MGEYQEPKKTNVTQTVKEAAQSRELPSAHSKITLHLHGSVQTSELL